MCIAPITLKRNTNTYNGSRKGAGADIVPCGKCIKCLQRKSSAWAFRLTEEQKHASSACFLTLTYDNDNIPLNSDNRNYPIPTLDKTHVQKFLKRLRKQVRNFETKTRRTTRSNGECIPLYSKIKYYAVGEYGTQTKRPHYHMIMFNLPHIYLQKPDHLNNLWGKGFVDIARSEQGSIRYVTNYILTKHRPKIDYETGEIFEYDNSPPFALMSKGMGKQFLTPQKKNTFAKTKSLTLPFPVEQKYPYLATIATSSIILNL